MLIDRSHRPWIAASVLILLLATAIYVPYSRNALNGPSGGSWEGLGFGIVGFAFMLFAGLLGLRRKVPTWRVGRATLWMRAHIWLGLLSFPLILFHGGFGFGGPLTLVLMILFIIVFVSGVVGLLLQQALPRLMLTRLPLETVYEQVDSVVVQLLAESDALIAAACGALPVEPVPIAEARRAALEPPRAADGAGPRGGERGAPRDLPARHPSVPRPDQPAERHPRYVEPRVHAVPPHADDAAPGAAGDGQRAGGHL